MPDTWNKLDGARTPALGDITAFVATPLWDELLAYLDGPCAARPQIEYSGCGMAPGWNVKYKKAGRGLCTLYPEQGWFTALVVIGQREKAEAELALPTFGAYTRSLYENTKEGMGQRWLMFRVDSAVVLQDVAHCIDIRRKAK